MKNRCLIENCPHLERSAGYCSYHYNKYVFMATRPLYNIWREMIQRCTNPKRWNYKYYGGRGIQVCERWRKNYYFFQIDVGLRPSPRHQLDRIDHDGNYEPGNVRWATPTQQKHNQGLRSTNTSGVTGVYYHKKYKKWHATITIRYRRHHLGWYKSFDEAVVARALAEARYTV